MTGDLPFDAAPELTPDVDAHVAQTIDPAGDGGRTIVLTIDHVDRVADRAAGPRVSSGADGAGAGLGAVADHRSSILDGGLETNWIVPERRSRRFARDEDDAVRGTRGAVRPAPSRDVRDVVRDPRIDVMGSRGADVLDAPVRMVDARSRRDDGAATPAPAPPARRRTARRPEPFVPPGRAAARAAEEASAAVAARDRAPSFSDGAERSAGIPRTEPVDAPRTVDPPRRRRSAPVSDWAVGDIWAAPAAAAVSAPAEASAPAGSSVPAAPAAVETTATAADAPADAELRAADRPRRRSPRTSAHHAVERRPSGPVGGVAGRRTVQIGGLATVPDVPRLVEVERRRPPRHAVDRLNDRPDRIAMWAFLLGMFLILVAAVSGGAV